VAAPPAMPRRDEEIIAAEKKLGVEREPRDISVRD
jgi:hypothetical protein